MEFPVDEEGTLVEVYRFPQLFLLGEIILFCLNQPVALNVLFKPVGSPATLLGYYIEFRSIQWVDPVTLLGYSMESMWEYSFYSHTKIQS